MEEQLRQLVQTFYDAGGKILVAEKALGMGPGTLQKFKNGTRTLPEKWHQPVFHYFTTGTAPEMSEKAEKAAIPFEKAGKSKPYPSQPLPKPSPVTYKAQKVDVKGDFEDDAPVVTTQAQRDYLTALSEKLFVALKHDKPRFTRIMEREIMKAEEANKPPVPLATIQEPRTKQMVEPAPGTTAWRMKTGNF